jgi:hypothetical protein
MHVSVAAKYTLDFHKTVISIDGRLMFLKGLKNSERDKVVGLFSRTLVREPIWSTIRARLLISQMSTISSIVRHGRKGSLPLGGDFRVGFPCQFHLFQACAAFAHLPAEDSRTPKHSQSDQCLSGVSLDSDRLIRTPRRAVTRQGPAPRDGDPFTSLFPQSGRAIVTFSTR